MGETSSPRVWGVFFYLRGRNIYDQETGEKKEEKKEKKNSSLVLAILTTALFTQTLAQHFKDRRPTFVHPSKRCMTEEVNHTYSSLR